MVLVACTVMACWGCASQSARTAPFRVRPDSVEAGDLRGPFHGRVVDAGTGKPIAGALVYATWTIQEGYGLNHPAGYRELVTNTDADGAYHVPALRDVDLGRGQRLTDFYLVVYKRGYVAYRSDRRFSDLGQRWDFAQTNHRIDLERWRSEYSHAHHLRYIGGGPAIAALTAWEAEEAATELSGASQPGTMRTDITPRTQGTYVVAAQLLGEDEIKAVTGYEGKFETGPLGDQPDTDGYSSQHFKAMGLPETYDIALRVWRLEPEQAQKRYAELSESLPGVEERNELADQSLRALEGEIHGIAFLDTRRGLVVLLTCGKGQCTSPDMASALGEAVFRRIQAIWPAPSRGLAPVPATPAPATPAPAPAPAGGAVKGVEP